VVQIPRSGFTDVSFLEIQAKTSKIQLSAGMGVVNKKLGQEFPHFFGTNKITPEAKWEAAKQRAPEPPLFRLSQPGKGQQRDVALSSPEHCHQWRELLVVEQPFTWPMETHFHCQTAHNLRDQLNP